MVAAFKSKYVPTPYQRDFHCARWRYPFRWLSAGVGTGKTVCALEEDLNYTQVIAPGKNGIILCPDYATLEQVVVPKLIEWWPPIWELRHVAGLPELRVQTPKGLSTIFVRVGSNKRSVRSISGLEAAWAHVEEGGRIHEGAVAWYYLQQRLREPDPNDPGGAGISYTDTRGQTHSITGPVHVSGTPWPGWLIDEFKCGEGHPPEALVSGYSNDGEHWIRQARTRDNPHLPEDFIERQYAKGVDSEWAQQELEGQIVQAMRRMVHNFYRETHTKTHAEAMAIYRDCPHKDIGVDFGFGHPAAMTVGGWRGGGAGTVTVREWCKAGRDDEELGYQVWKAQKELGARNVYLPPEEFESRRQRWRKGFYYNNGGGDRKYHIRHIKRADNSRAAGFSTMRNNCTVRMQGMGEAGYGWVVSEECPNLIQQTIDARRPTDIEIQMGQAKGADREGAIVPMEDDALDAERYRQQTGGKGVGQGGQELRR
jgi:hypothetical protein